MIFSRMVSNYNSVEPIFAAKFIILLHLLFLGIDVDTPDGRMKAHVMLLFSCVDLPAQALMLNMKQFNGKWGCNYCEDEGVPRRSCHLHRNWPYEESVVLRTHQSMMQNAHDSKASSSVSDGHETH